MKYICSDISSLKVSSALFDLTPHALDVSRKKSCNLVFDQIRHKPAFAVTENMYYLGSEK